MEHLDSLIFEDIQKQLKLVGLNLFSSISLADLQEELLKGLQSAASQPISQYHSVMVIGQAGGKIWDTIEASLETDNDPVDNFSIREVSKILTSRINQDSYEIVFPGDGLISLQKLGRQCGWGEPSWLGINIYESLGTWYAFRAVVLVKCRVPKKLMKTLESPCLTCVDKPCVSVCPASAPAEPGNFNLGACVDYRVSSDSACAHNCLARYSCPVASELAYPSSMANYFYGRSLITLKRWKEDAKEDVYV